MSSARIQFNLARNNEDMIVCIMIFSTLFKVKIRYVCQPGIMSITEHFWFGTIFGAQTLELHIAMPLLKIANGFVLPFSLWQVSEVITHLLVCVM